MSTAPKPEKPRRAVRPLVPPEEGFWTRYSPHHEFPLSSVTSFAVCTLALGLLLGLALWREARAHDELDPRRPPEMNVVEIEGGGGTDGFAPRGDGGVGQVPGKTEGVEPNPQPNRTEANPWRPSEQLRDDLKADPLQVPVRTKEDEPGPGDIFEKIAADAKKQSKEPPPKSLPSQGTAGKPGQIGVKNPGKGGFTGGGQFGGSGAKTGRKGGNSPTGVVLSKQHRRAMRWSINFSGKTEDHEAKLRALSVLLATPSRQPGVVHVWDMKVKNPSSRLDNLSSYASKVQFQNRHAPSMQQLGQVLRLPQPPAFAFIILPEMVEDEMLRLERQFRGREEHEIRLTEFEIQTRPDGTYGPVVVNQQTW